MSITNTFATSGRVLAQLRHDPRTLGLVIVVPCLLMVVLRFVFDGQPLLFNNIAPMILGIFPLLMMFLVTSIATLRERTTGTLDRLMTEPISKLDFIFGYALAFSLLALIQVAVVCLVTLGFLDVSVAGGTLLLIFVALVSALLGTALGLFVSAFARSEFQAVQLVMPIVMPQVLICGLFVPRDDMAQALQRAANVLPITYSVDAMKQVTNYSGWTTDLKRDLVIIIAFVIVVLVLGSVTIRRREK